MLSRGKPRAPRDARGLGSWTGGIHCHAFRSQRSHIRATHVRGPEKDRVACSEPCVVEQRLNVGKVGVGREFSSVRPPGLEPGTLGLEGRCSIHLSYERK